jgi:hypothetical protein
MIRHQGHDAKECAAFAGLIIAPRRSQDPTLAVERSILNGRRARSFKLPCDGGDGPASIAGFASSFLKSWPSAE